MMKRKIAAAILLGALALSAMGVRFAASLHSAGAGYQVMADPLPPPIPPPPH
jgi:hypothetical protein